ncbi:Polynucleotide 5'-hydroxyl-kinase grc3 [Coemansia sp. RSA 2050]|nr:Polynucleotide 5'-hydroxyl-kinase grc3 [Coemansia sp. RSA 2050]KAJ2728603.1 Polynucleotide 5'-hydroxyl-kinase grc3 [Coemansia sp. BCRC 34962]
MLVGSSGQGDSRRLAAIGSSVPIEERYGAIVEIPEGKAVVFQGIVDVCVLSGTVSVCEYSIMPGSQWRRVYSPSSHPLVSVRSIRTTSSANSTLCSDDADIPQLQALWEASTKAAVASGGNVSPRSSGSVIAFRSVFCGLEHIGVAAPPYRSLFTLKHFSERQEMGLPKKPAKRKLALSRLVEANKTRRAARESTSRGASQPTTDAESDKPRTEDDAMESDTSDEEFSAVVECMHREDMLVDLMGLPNFYPVSHLTAELQLLQVPVDWTETLNLASTSALQLDDNFEPTPPVYVIAGTQGQGKSTFARLLLNRLISRYGRIFYMETDLGQSELSPPGALTLAMLTDPLLGPPFTHSGVTEAYHAVYMGVTTPKNDPDRYVTAIKRLTAVYRDHIAILRMQRALAGSDGDNPAYASSAADLDRQVIPLVVNTQGWLKGLGLDLHYSLCESVKPTNYVQLYDAAGVLEKSDYEAREWSASNGLAPIINFSGIEACDPRLVWISAMSYERATQMLSSQPLEVSSDSLNEEASEANAGDSQPLATMDSAGRKGNKLVAHDMRALSLISQLYLAGGSVQSQPWNGSLQLIANPQWCLQAPLASRRPLAVPWADLVVWLGEEDVPASQLLRALNGAVVGVVAISTAPSPDAHTWTESEIRSLYSGASGITDQAAIELSEPGSRALLHSTLDECRPARPSGLANELRLPHIVYGQPNTNNTTFLAHALVRSIDPVEGQVHLLLPPNVVRPASDSGCKARLSTLHRIVGIVKGPGPSTFGIDLPVWSLVDGGYAERSMGSSSVRQQGRFNRRTGGREHSAPLEAGNGEGSAPLGIQEAPYLSVEVDEGIGATSTRSKGGMQRRALQ